MHPTSLSVPLTVFKHLSRVIVAPISTGTPRISRSNSIGPPSESACDLYGSSPLGSSMSLADRPKSLMRCGSFREPGDDGEPAPRASTPPRRGVAQRSLKRDKAFHSCSTQSVQEDARTIFVSTKKRKKCSLCAFILN